MDAKQLSVLRRRGRLSPEAQKECRRLDDGLSIAQKDEKTATPSNLKDFQMSLYKLRKRFQELGC
jgi:hypothetical protein